MSSFCLDFPVVGVTFENRQEIWSKILDDNLSFGVLPAVKLEKEDDNPYDSNAVAVRCLVDNDFKKVGYLPKRVNEGFRNIVKDKGFNCWIKSVGRGASGDIGASLRIEILG